MGSFEGKTVLITGAGRAVLSDGNADQLAMELQPLSQRKERILF